MWAYDTLMAKKELQGFFKSKMTEDRAYYLGLKVTGSEAEAFKYVMALTNSEADRYGSRS